MYMLIFLFICFVLLFLLKIKQLSLRKVERQRYDTIGTIDFSDSEEDLDASSPSIFSKTPDTGINLALIFCSKYHFNITYVVATFRKCVNRFNLQLLSYCTIFHVNLKYLNKLRNFLFTFHFLVLDEPQFTNSVDNYPPLQAKRRSLVPPASLVLSVALNKVQVQTPAITPISGIVQFLFFHLTLLYLIC